MEAGLGLHTLGIFTSGYGISVGIISAFESTFTAYLMPIFYRSISYGGANEQSSAWRAYADAIFPSLVLLGFFILATAPELTRVILGPAYQSSYRYVGWGVLAEVGRVAGAVYAMVAHAGMKTKLLLAPSLVGAILALILIWFLMPRYGANGVGIALMVASLVACGLTYAVTRSIFSTKLPRAALMKSALIGASLLLLAVILRWICGQNVNLFATVTQLLTVSVAFALCQYMLLRPLLNRN
jgi:O-antigen/teichoic acid export membrane protein